MLCAASAAASFGPETEVPPNPQFVSRFLLKFNYLFLKKYISLL
jgi:hypothetical protein